MNAHHGFGYERARSNQVGRATATSSRRGSDVSRWGLWAVSLLVGAAAVLGVVLTGASGASTGVPGRIQVGAQAITTTPVTRTPSTAPSRTPSRAPSSTSGTSGTSSTTVAPLPTTTVASEQRTTLIQPHPKVTDHEESGGSDASSAGN
ncbi:MAG: hypothetical protein HKL86_08160 [Acidimicrobiaceae bacterium]|nr:hypothetical protein [Acidimicrobiaceae bacterium]